MNHCLIFPNKQKSYVGDNIILFYRANSLQSFELSSRRAHKHTSERETFELLLKKQQRRGRPVNGRKVTTMGGLSIHSG